MSGNWLCSQPRNRRPAYIVALGEFRKRCPLCPPPPCFLLLQRRELRRSPHVLPARLRPAAALRRPGADQVALPSTAIISRPVLVAVSAHGSASDRNCPPASTICLTMANRSKVERASRAIRVTGTTSPGLMALWI